MRRRSIIAVAAMVGLLTASQTQAGDAQWWGRKLPDAPSQFIFGYGSLINTASRNATASAPIPAIPVRVAADFGFIRTWNDRSPSGFTALGLRRPGPGEQPTTINGVLYAVAGDDMSKFDAREVGYARVEVPHEKIEALSWQSIPKDGRIWVYVPVRPGHDPGVDPPQVDAAYPLLESYIDVVIEGCLEYGPDYARELIETTSGWSQYWLNDRELARRPWVHDALSSTVDQFLAKVPPASTHLGDRLFSEQYAIRWAAKSQ